MERDFRKELEQLINHHGKENGSNTPDFLLATFLNGVLEIFDATVRGREEWYGRTGHPIVRTQLDGAGVEQKSTEPRK